MGWCFDPEHFGVHVGEECEAREKGQDSSACCKNNSG